MIFIEAERALFLFLYAYGDRDAISVRFSHKEQIVLFLETSCTVPLEFLIRIESSVTAETRRRNDYGEQRVKQLITFATPENVSGNAGR